MPLYGSGGNSDQNILVGVGAFSGRGVDRRSLNWALHMQMEFDTLLKFINDLSGRIELEATLRDAEALCRYAGEAGVACMPPAPPPTDETQIEGPEG